MKKLLMLLAFVLALPAFALHKVACIDAFEASVNAKLNSIKDQRKVQLDAFRNSVCGKLDSWETNADSYINDFEKKTNSRLSSLFSDSKAKIDAFDAGVKAKLDAHDASYEAYVDGFRSDISSRFKSVFGDEGLKQDYKQLKSVLKSDLSESDYALIESDLSSYQTEVESEMLAQDALEEGGDLADDFDTMSDAIDTEYNSVTSAPAEDGFVHLSFIVPWYENCGTQSLYLKRGQSVVITLTNTGGTNNFNCSLSGTAPSLVFSIGQTTNGNAVAANASGSITPSTTQLVGSYYWNGTVKGTWIVSLVGGAGAIIDSDGDGFSDAAEAAAGSDPNDPDSKPTNVDSDGDGIPDYMDSDKDGDGIPDANSTDGKVDPGYTTGIPSVDKILAKLRPDFSGLSPSGSGELDTVIPMETDYGDFSLRLTGLSEAASGWVGIAMGIVRNISKFVFSCIFVFGVVRSLRQW